MTQPKIFIVFFNIVAIILLMLNQFEIIKINLIWIRLLYLLLFIWNILLFYFISKNKTN